jgi:uroporphyrinogen-III synthase
MPDRRYTILSTTSLPFERVSPIPDSIDIQVVPFIKIIPGDSLELVPVISEMALQNKNVVFTSAHAVRIVKDCLKQIPNWKIFCVRQETRMAVEKFFGSGSVVRYGENARQLSALVISEGVREAVFFCGDRRLDILPEILRNHGLDLEELIVYQTRLTPVHLSEKPDAVLFFSPTAVDSFFSMNGLSPGVAVFAMGKTTADALKKFTELPVLISPETDKAFVVAMAMEYAQSHPII